MNDFITTLVGMLTTEKFPIFVSVFLLLKVTLSIDKIKQSIETLSSKIEVLINKIADNMNDTKYKLMKYELETAKLRKESHTSDKK